MITVVLGVMDCRSHEAKAWFLSGVMRGCDVKIWRKSSFTLRPHCVLQQDQYVCGSRPPLSRAKHPTQGQIKLWEAECARFQRNGHSIDGTCLMSLPLFALVTSCFVLKERFKMKSKSKQC